MPSEWPLASFERLHVDGWPEPGWGSGFSTKPFFPLSYFRLPEYLCVCIAKPCPYRFLHITINLCRWSNSCRSHVDLARFHRIKLRYPSRSARFLSGIDSIEILLMVFLGFKNCSRTEALRADMRVHKDPFSSNIDNKNDYNICF